MIASSCSHYSMEKRHGIERDAMHGYGREVIPARVLFASTRLDWPTSSLDAVSNNIQPKVFLKHLKTQAPHMSETHAELSYGLSQRATRNLTIIFYGWSIMLHRKRKAKKGRQEGSIFSLQ